MQSMHVTVYYNQAQDDQGRPVGYNGYRAAHPLKRMLEGADLLVGVDESLGFDARHEAAAERAFAVLNRGSAYCDYDLMDEHKMRSLSVGDVVAVRESGRYPRTYYFSCEPAGWRRIIGAAVAGSVARYEAEGSTR